VKFRDEGTLVPHETCGRKVKYTKVEARTAANFRARHGSDPLRCYECPDCGGWHLSRIKGMKGRREYGRPGEHWGPGRRR
jgi:hypothetical protein